MQHTKRGRNQRRRPGGGSNPNRALDSNGPEVRIRGTANQIYDKYIALARDASSSGDRIKAESYFQHAEHYFRIIKATQQAQQNQQAQRNSQHQKQGDGRSEQPAVGDSDATTDERQNETRESHKEDNESVKSKSGSEVKPITEPDQVNEESAENSATSDATEGAEKKPRRRRARRPVKRADNDEPEKGSEEAESATAAAE